VRIKTEEVFCKKSFLKHIYHRDFRNENFLKMDFEFKMGLGRSPLPFSFGTSTKKVKKIKN